MANPFAKAVHESTTATDGKPMDRKPLDDDVLADIFLGPKASSLCSPRTTPSSQKELSSSESEQSRSSRNIMQKWSTSMQTVLSVQRVSANFVTLRDQFSVTEVDPKHLVSVQKLGEGAFAVVDKCVLTNHGATRSVAVKRLKPAVASSPRDLDAFLTEVALMRKLKHKRIVSYIGMGAQDLSSEESAKLTLFLVEEFVGGGTLRKLVSKQMCEPNRCLYSTKQALQWLIDVASALAYLHASIPMVIHRDLKMDNILLTSDKAHAKLADFGLAGVTRKGQKERRKSTEPAEPETEESTVQELEDKYRKALSSVTSGRRRNKAMAFPHFQPRELEGEGTLPGRTGTLMYMAPEMFENKPYDEKVDVFSFGVIMHELFSRYLMICAISTNGTEREIEAYAKRVAAGFRPPLDNELWHEELTSLITSCWHPDPTKRPCMADVVTRLQRLRDENLLHEDRRSMCGTCRMC